MVENFYLKRDFEDFEEFAENLRLWNIQIQKLQKGKSTNTLKQLKLGEIQIAYGYFQGKTHQVGDTPPGRTIAFHVGNNSQLTWRKKKVPYNGLMIFPNNSELDAVTKGTNNNIFTITIPEDLLASRIPTEAQGAYHKLVSTQDLICIPKDYLSRLQHLIQMCFQAIENKPELTTSQSFEQKIQEEILYTVSQALSPVECNLPRSTRIPKNKIWENVEEAMNLYLSSPLKVSELSQAAGVSERTLQRLFQGHFGVSPKAYLCRLRLNEVRHNLKRSIPGEVVITDIANNWGFWHMGQFASDYRKLFGELPSDTLRQRVV